MVPPDPRPPDGEALSVQAEKVPALPRPYGSAMFGAGVRLPSALLLLVLLALANTQCGGEAMLPTATSPWAVILAGGEGVRLRPLTQRLTGDARPKQFCRLFGPETLLDATRRRAELVIRPDRQVVVVTAAHAPYYADLGRELLPGRLLAQPQNRG